MTQIIATITREYVLLVADRRLTFLHGPMQGQLADDDTCKLVSLCNTCGIGYTGLAQIEGLPTHEWIAKTLASERCSDPAHASRILSERASVALSGVHLFFRRQTFLIAGWAYFDNLAGLRPHVCAITNMMDMSGRMLSKTEETFSVLTNALNDNQDLAIHVVGQPLQLERGQSLERNLRSLIEKEISARAALRLLVDEIIHTSTKFQSVGKKVLGLCIPRRAVQSSLETGRSKMIATEPNEDAASFYYYDQTYNELKQSGPTITCGGFAATDVKTENDISVSRQTSSIRILASPKNDAQLASPVAPVFKSARVGRPIIAFELGISVDNAVARGSVYAIPAAVRNTGKIPIAFARNLSDEVGQEDPPSVQGGAVPAIALSWPIGGWSISSFTPASRTKFAGVLLAPGDVLKFNFGSFTVPRAPMGATSRSIVVDFSIRFTDTIFGQLVNVTGANFGFPTNVGPTLRFRIDAKSASSGLSFRPARVIDTATGELISGPVEGSPSPTCSGVAPRVITRVIEGVRSELGGTGDTITDTAISTGRPGIIL